MKFVVAVLFMWSGQAVAFSRLKNNAWFLIPAFILSFAGYAAMDKV